MKVCARCEKPKPLTAFGNHPKTRDGLCSWCRDCHTEEIRAWRARNPGYTNASKIAKRGRYADPVAYSKHVCEHVAEFVTSAISKFESKTGKEAPPHLSAILSLATNLAEQQEPSEDRQTIVRVCTECGEDFESHTDNLRRCLRCTKRKRYARNKKRRAVFTQSLIGDGGIRTHPETGVRYDVRRPPTVRAYEHVCAECGDTFEAARRWARRVGFKCESCRTGVAA